MQKKLEIFQKNYALLVTRHPHMYCPFNFTVQSTGILDELIVSESFENRDLLYVYGFCSLKHIMPWLKKSKIRKVVFLEDDISEIYEFLTSSEATAILKNPQVFFHFLLSSKNSILSIVEHYVAKKMTVLCSTRKGKKSQYFQKIKNELLHKSAWNYGWHLESLHYYHHLENFVLKLPFLQNSFHAIDLRGKFKDIPAVICGGGPSLQKSKKMLKKVKNKALILAGGSSFTFLNDMGIKPSFAIAVDPNIEEYKRFQTRNSWNIPLIYTMRLYHKVLYAFQAPLGLFWANTGDFMENFLRTQIDIPKCKYQLQTETNSVIGLNLLFAYLLGCNPIIFCGFDLAYFKDNKYGSSILKDDDKEKTIFLQQVALSKDKKTNIGWQMDANAVSAFIKDNGKKILLNVSNGMNIEGVLATSWEKILSEHLKSNYDIDHLVKSAINSSNKILEEEKIEKMVKELFFSFKRCNKLIQKISKIIEEKKAKTIPAEVALEEIELSQEMAFKYFLFDILSQLKKIAPCDIKPKKLLQEQWRGLKKASTLCTSALRQHF